MRPARLGQVDGYEGGSTLLELLLLQDKEENDDDDGGSNGDGGAWVAAAGMRDVQVSAGVGLREQTFEHELAERKRRVHVQQQNMRN